MKRFTNRPSTRTSSHCGQPHPHQVVLVLAAQQHLDAVHAVDRELVRNGDPAARPQRQVVPLPRVLHDVDGDLERVGARARRRESRRQPGHLPRDGQIPLDVRGRQPENVGEVVEAAVGGLVARQQRLDVHVEREQVADGVAVLRAVDAVDGVDPPRVGVGGPGAVQLGLQPPRHVPVGLVVRPRTSGRRHRAGPQPGRHPLPRVRVGRHVLHVESRDGETGRPQPVVVATDAVPTEHASRLRVPAGGGLRQGRRSGTLRRAGRRFAGRRFTGRLEHRGGSARDSAGQGGGDHPRGGRAPPPSAWPRRAPAILFAPCLERHAPPLLIMPRRSVDPARRTARPHVVSDRRIPFTALAPRPVAPGSG